MANVYNGLGVAQQIIGMHNDSQDRKNRQRREENIAAAGQVAAGGDTKRASEMLMAAGDIDGAMAFEDIANSREDREFLREERAEVRRERKEARHNRSAVSNAIRGLAEGELTPDAMKGAAGILAQAGQADAAMGMIEGAHQMTEQQKVQVAQSYVNAFSATPKDQRHEALKSMAEEHKDSIDPALYDMMTNDNPDDDLRAAILWGGQNGADVSAIQAELDRAEAIAVEKEMIEYEARIRAQYKKSERGEGPNPYYGSAALMEPSERRLIMQTEKDMLTSADEIAGQAAKYADAATRWVQYAIDNDVSTEHMGGGAGGQVQRNREGLMSGKWTALAGIAEEMVRMTRVPGSGVFTDADAERAQKSVIGAQKSWVDNQRAEKFARMYSNHMRGRADFLRWARDSFGHAGGMDSPQARAVWEAYRDANQLTVATGTNEAGEEMYALNDNYQDFKSWLGSQMAMQQNEAQYQQDSSVSAEDLNAELDAL